MSTKELGETRRKFRNNGDTVMSTKKFWMRSESIDMEDCDNLRDEGYNDFEKLRENEYREEFREPLKE